jgi:hypothetical protein
VPALKARIEQSSEYNGLGSTSTAEAFSYCGVVDAIFKEV